MFVYLSFTGRRIELPTVETVVTVEEAGNIECRDATGTLIAVFDKGAVAIFSKEDFGPFLSEEEISSFASEIARD